MISYLKRRAKRLLSPELWAALSHLKARTSASGLICSFVNMLPLQLAARVKEGVELVGRLDYSRRDIRMRVDGVLQVSRLYACEKEPETVAWIEAYVKPGDVFYDIGANVGAYSFVAYAATDGHARIYAFEPSFSTFAALSYNVMLNRCEGRITPLHMALSDTTEMQEFRYSAIGPGAAMHALGREQERQLCSPRTYAQEILTYRLDDLIAQFGLPWPNHLKLDVDGAERRVLLGSANILAKPTLRSILVEVDDNEDPGHEIERMLTSYRFVLRSRHCRRNTLTVANYVFERSE